MPRLDIFLQNRKHRHQIPAHQLQLLHIPLIRAKHIHHTINLLQNNTCRDRVPRGRVVTDQSELVDKGLELFLGALVGTGRRVDDPSLAAAAAFAYLV